MRIPARVENAGGAVLVFWAALAILALHAATDSFIAPEPGTGPLDHLLRGSVSLAILVVAAVVYPRLQAGGRAALAGVFGALALEGAILAIADARGSRARGEDWTGFLLTPVGLVLLGSVGVLLWRSRKPGRLRWPRRAGIAIGTLVAVYWLILPVGMAILATHRPRADVRHADLGKAYEKVTLHTSDGLDLAAWYVPSRNGAAVISVLDEVVARIAPRPLFLIYAAHGGGGEELNPDYFEAASEPKTVWRVDEAEHVGGFDARPREYEERVIGFFDQALLQESD